MRHGAKIWIWLAHHCNYNNAPISWKMPTCQLILKADAVLLLIISEYCSGLQKASFVGRRHNAMAPFDIAYQPFSLADGALSGNASGAILLHQFESICGTVGRVLHQMKLMQSLAFNPGRGEPCCLSPFGSISGRLSVVLFCLA